MLASDGSIAEEAMFNTYNMGVGMILSLIHILASYVEKKIEERKEAKKAKDFAKADAIREELLAKGIVLKDTREGTFWEKQ